MSIMKAELSPLASAEAIESGRFYEGSKRIMDIIVSASAIGVLSPVFLAVALVVRLSSSGPIFFRQRRLGKGQTQFWCYKFRTMLVDAESRLMNNKALRAEFETNFKLKNDPRITKFGSFLRKTSLDELPQFFNVLEGSMSLIGPRPLVPCEHSKYRQFGDRLLTVKPGLGGCWQVYRRSETTYEERIQMDMSYIHSRSFLLDLKLMVLTVVNVLMRHGAY